MTTLTFGNTLGLAVWRGDLTRTRLAFIDGSNVRCKGITLQQGEGRALADDGNCAVILCEVPICHTGTERLQPMADERV